jgi:hypothetical protein
LGLRQLNGAVTRTLKKCGDPKASIGAFKESHLELKAILKSMAALDGQWCGRR